MHACIRRPTPDIAVASLLLPPHAYRHAAHQPPLSLHTTPPSTTLKNNQKTAAPLDEFRRTPADTHTLIPTTTHKTATPLDEFRRLFALQPDALSPEEENALRGEYLAGIKQRNAHLFPPIVLVPTVAPAAPAAASVAVPATTATSNSAAPAAEAAAATGGTVDGNATGPLQP